MKKAFGSVIAGTAVALSACSVSQDPVVIAADPSSPEQLVLAEIYRQVIELDDKDVFLTGPQMLSSGDRLAILERNEADLAVVCAGELVTDANQGEVGALKEAKAKQDAEDAPDLELVTYDAAVATLPGYLMTLDPSPAQGCPASARATELPQNILPVFRRELFDRGVRSAMSQVTRALNTGDLEELIQAVGDGADPSVAVNKWMIEETGMGSELKRIVQDGEARDT